MRLIWTKSNLILSKLIRWGLNEDCSHFAIVFDSPAGGLMFESNLLGTHPKFYKTAKKHCEIVHEIVLNVSVEVEDRVWDIVVDNYDDEPYNFGAFLYFAWRAFLYKAFKRPFPAVNKWSKPDTHLCDQLYDAVENIAAPNLNIDLAITSPHKVYEKLKELGL